MKSKAHSLVSVRVLGTPGSRQSAAGPRASRFGAMPKDPMGASTSRIEHARRRALGSYCACNAAFNVVIACCARVFVRAIHNA